MKDHQKSDRGRDSCMLDGVAAVQDEVNRLPGPDANPQSAMTVQPLSNHAAS